MKIIKEKITDSGVVGVVTAILLVGLIVAVVSLVQTMYIPKIMKEREADHMDKVSEQFTYITSIIDNQAANPSNNMPIATSITLGSKELPYMLSMKAFGTLEILENDERTITVTKSDGTTLPPYQIGVITYSSTNAYFLDQTYTYEAGAMIVSQPGEGNLMMIRPSFVVEELVSSGKFNVNFTIVNIVSVGEKTIASGYATYPIQTEFRDISDTIIGVSQITIHTPFSNAWRVFLKSTLMEVADLNDDSESDIVVTFYPSVSANVIVKIINIKAQIGPGWIEYQD